MQPAAGMMITPNLRLTRPLGQGGMASVWGADHLALRTEVAIKLIDPQLAARNPEMQARFMREASTAAQIKSPHVVQMFDHGLAGDGTPFIVMELLQGESLRDRLIRKGRMTPGEVVTLLSQACRALDGAHRLGIIHRDLKPANLFLVSAGYDIFVKVLDFGIAKGGAEHAAGMETSSMAVIGTPRYMSPEQLMSTKNVGPGTDLWALGVIAYEALLGKRPYDGDTVPQLTMQICSGEFVPPSQIEPSLPAELDRFFARVFRLDPRWRFGSAGELASVFETSCGGAVQPGSARLGGPSSGGQASRQGAGAASGLAMPAGAGTAAGHGGRMTGPMQAQGASATPAWIQGGVTQQDGAPAWMQGSGPPGVPGPHTSAGTPHAMAGPPTHPGAPVGHPGAAPGPGHPGAAPGYPNAAPGHPGYPNAPPGYPGGPHGAPGVTPAMSGAGYALSGGSTTSALSMGRPPSVSKSNKPLLVALLAVVGALVMGGVVAGMVLGRSLDAPKEAAKEDTGGSGPPGGMPCFFERCEPSVKVPRSGTVEALDYLKPATALARQMEPKAELVMITTSMMNGGEFSLESPGTVALMFTYPKQGKPGKVATLQLIINYHQMMGRRTPDMGVKPVGIPSCTLQAALKQVLAVKPFSDTNDISAVYMWDPQYNRPAWRITQVDPVAVRVVDGATCKLIPE